MPSARAEALEKLLQIVDALREPDGCPWDRKQTVASMATYVIEEAYELVEKIELGDDAGTREELGDLLLVLALICRIASESGRFDLEEAAQAIREKVVRRHPHVFGERAEAQDAEEALASWESVKREERKDAQIDASALAGLPLALPALGRAARLCEKAVAAGFRWDTAAGAWAKVEEELGELRRALEGTDLDAAKVRPQGAARERIEAELGDLLMAGAFFGRYLGLDPERVCRDALRRFEDRFRRMEAGLAAPIDSFELPRLMEAWESAKNGDA
jgi:MazG family protein